MLKKLFKKNSKDDEKVVKISEETEDVKGVLKGGVPDVTDLITPDCFDRSKTTYFKIGDYYCKTIFITGLPREVAVGWLNPFLNHEGDLDLSIHISPVQDRDALFELSKMITKLDTALSMQKGNIRMVNELQQAIIDLNGIRQLIQNNRSRLFMVSIMANLYNKDLEQLEREVDFLEGKLGGYHIHTRLAEGRMDEGFYSVSPIGVNLMSDTYRIMDSLALGTTLPFVTADITHANGFPFCINYSTGAPVFLDHYDSSLDNHSCVIFAGAGSGKSTTEKVKIGRAYFTGERTAIIDPEGEYGKLVEAVGGLEYVIGPDSPTRFNPCELEAEFDKNEGKKVVKLLDKYNDLVELFGTMVGNISSEEESMVEEAVREVYSDCGFTSDPESLYEKKSVLDENRGLYKHAKELKKMPRLSDIVGKLRKKGPRAERIVVAMGRYLEGGSLGFFDCESNISLKDLDNAPIINFNISRCEAGNARKIAMQIIANWIWQKFILRGDPKAKKRIVFDEGHHMLDDEFSARFLERLVRRIRKRTGGIDVISQDALKFAEHKRGRAVLDNCSTKIFLKQEETMVDTLIGHFKLSEGIRSFLRSCGKGEGVLLVGKKAAAFKVVPSEMEKNWVFTSALLEDEDIA